MGVGTLRDDLASLHTQLTSLAEDSPVAEGRLLPEPDNQDRDYEALQGFKVNFDGNPDNLAFFLIQVGSYMEVHGGDLQSERKRVFEVGTQLRGEAANWLAGLVEGDAPEIYNLEWFLLALRWRFEDPLAEEKARAALQRLRQGNHSDAWSKPYRITLGGRKAPGQHVGPDGTTHLALQK
uniref:Uncharacterized protein n=1 Tax=Sphaerodactylus townsendi TaxID=933632 RepID=A0ACB8F8H9_9SAUR